MPGTHRRFQCSNVFTEQGEAPAVTAIPNGGLFDDKFVRKHLISCRGR